MKRFWMHLMLILVWVGARAAEPVRQGMVQFSDGGTLSGVLALSHGAAFKLHGDKKNLHTFTLDALRELRFAPVEEKMEQRWRFPVAGQTRKEKFGKPYPTCHIRATAVLAGGETVEGHLYTTVVYVQTSNKTHKAVLRSKLHGKEGETFEDLVYPVRITLDQVGQAVEGGCMLEPPAELGRVKEIVALTHGALVRLEACRSREKKADVKAFHMPSDLGSTLFLAIHAVPAEAGPTLTVAWPAFEGDDQQALEKLVHEKLKHVSDFFDERALLGVWRDSKTKDVYSLLMLTRAGQTTFGAKRSQPWRLGIWRWKEGDENRLMVAGRGYFFRGILAKNETVPPVVVSPDLAAKLLPVQAGKE